MSHSLSTFAAALIASGVLSFLASPAAAQTPPANVGESRVDEAEVSLQPARRGEPARLVVGGERLLVEIPDGWILARREPGSQLVLRAAGDDACSLDIKITERLSKRAAARFFDAFHTSLRRGGLSVAQERHRLNVDGFEDGTRTEYEVTTPEGREYTLLVWQGYRSEGAWLVTSFFPKKARDNYIDALSGLVEGVSVEKATTPTTP